MYGLKRYINTTVHKRCTVYYDTQFYAQKLLMGVEIKKKIDDKVKVENILSNSSLHFAFT